MSKLECVGFEHVHQHTDFSLLDGYAKIEELAERARKINQQYLCVSDHGAMGAVPRQIRAAEENKIKPVFAIELYVNPMQMELKSGEVAGDYAKQMSEEEKVRFRKSNHLLAIAYNETGYTNLVKMSSWAWTKGFYYRPRVNHEVIMAHREGVIFTSCCYNGEIGQAFDRGGEEAGFAMIEKYMAMFGENFRLELMLLDFKKQKPYDAFIIKAHDKYHIPLILTNDVHYAAQDDSKMQQLMLMIQTNSTIATIQQKASEGADLFEIQDQNLWMKSEEELNEKWQKDYSDVIDYDLFKQSKLNTVAICEKAAGVQLDRSIKLPKFDSDSEKLAEAIYLGSIARGIPQTKQYSDRLKEEFALIKEKGFASYFLIQKMMTDEARRISPILLGWGDGSEAVGPGRGCLDGNVPVVMKSGFHKPLKDIKVDDFVWTNDGTIRRVKNVMKYPLKEEKLKRIKTYYGDDVGVTLTLDHKIFAEKANRPQGWENLSEETRKARKSWEEPNCELNWFRAEELSVGDWCFIPTPVVEIIDEFIVDLSEFSVGNSKNGNKLTCNNEIVSHEFNSKGGTTLRNLPRYWKLDESWAFILGVFAGDGWTRSNGSNQVGFCDNNLERPHINQVIDFFVKNQYIHSEYIHKEKETLIQIVVSSPYLRGLFDKLHPQYKHTAQTKHVPDCIINAPLNIVESYLKGYFLSDGHEDLNKVKFDTVSSKLAEQIRFLFLRMGIPSSIVRTERTDDRPDFSNIKPCYTLTCPLDVRLGCSRDAKEKYVWRRTKDGLILKIRQIDEIEEIDTVYDIEIDDNHNYLTSSFLVHNSAAGSLVAYVTGITDVDPIHHDLMFSRFLSPARGGRSMKLKFSSDPIGQAVKALEQSLQEKLAPEECPFE